MITCCGIHKWLEEFKADLYDPLKHPNIYIFANMNIHFSCFLFIEDLAWLPIFYHVGKLLHLFILSYYLPGSGLKRKSHLWFLFPLIPLLQSTRMNCVLKLQNTPQVLQLPVIFTNFNWLSYLIWITTVIPLFPFLFLCIYPQPSS